MDQLRFCIKYFAFWFILQKNTSISKKFFVSEKDGYISKFKTRNVKEIFLNIILCGKNMSKVFQDIFLFLFVNGVYCPLLLMIYHHRIERHVSSVSQSCSFHSCAWLCFYLLRMILNCQRKHQIFDKNILSPQFLLLTKCKYIQNFCSHYIPRVD